MDAHAPAVERSRAAGIHDDYVIADVLTAGDHFDPDSFDAVVAIDLTEHLDEISAAGLPDHRPQGAAMIAPLEQRPPVRLD